jgi:hypothetical protein
LPPTFFEFIAVKEERCAAEPSDVNETQGKDPQGDIQSCKLLNQSGLLKFSLPPFTHSSAFLLFASCHGDLPRNEPDNNQTKKKEIRNLTSSFYRLGAIYDPNVLFVDRNGGGGEKSRTRKNFYFHWVGADILLVALNC